MGCCGNRSAATPDAPPSDWVLLEYIGTSKTSIRFRSNITGNVYRAGLDNGYHQVAMHPSDAPEWVAKGLFKVVEADEVAEDKEPAPTAKRSKK